MHTLPPIFLTRRSLTSEKFTQLGQLQLRIDCYCSEGANLRSSVGRIILLELLNWIVSKDRLL